MRKFITVVLFVMIFILIIDKKVSGKINDEIVPNAFNPGCGISEICSDPSDDDGSQNTPPYTILSNLTIGFNNSGGYFQNCNEVHLYEFVAPMTGYYSIHIESMPNSSAIGRLRLDLWLSNSDYNTVASVNNFEVIEYDEYEFIQGMRYYVHIQNASPEPYSSGGYFFKLEIKDNNYRQHPVPITANLYEQDLISPQYIDYIGDDDYYTFTTDSDVVLRIYTVGAQIIFGYLLDENNEEISYDTIDTSQVNIYFALKAGKTYTLRLEGNRMGFYSIRMSPNIGNHVIEPNSIRTFNSSVVYQKGLDYLGYFTNTEDAKDFLDYLSPNAIKAGVNALVCWGVTKIQPIVGGVCDILFVATDAIKALIINNLKNQLNYIQGSGVVVYFGISKIVVMPWDNRVYEYSEIYQNCDSITIDSY